MNANAKTKIFPFFNLEMVKNVGVGRKEEGLKNIESINVIHTEMEVCFHHEMKNKKGNCNF